MARLNEPAPSIESIESLKRRFIRQNRDLARANSTQSMRIRSLENETSRLLAENLDLREQIIQFENELENNKAQQIVENTRATRTQLESKLLELGALINSLGDEPVRKKAQTPKRAGSISRSPPQKDWRNMYAMGEMSRGLEGSLPPILETKLYPRKTLELQELEAMLADDAADTTGSPEIGPPPVSQFVSQDPVKVDLAIRPRKLESDELLGLDPVLSVNLEQRKKRKDSIEPRRISQTEPRPEKDASTPLRTGAKRKMSVMDEEREVPTKTYHSSPDHFQFTRVVDDNKPKNRTTTHAEKPTTREAKEVTAAKESVREKQSSAIAPTTRTVLAAKSVNNSPKKSSKLNSSGAIKDIKPDDSNPKPAARPRGKPRNEAKIEPASTKTTSGTVVKTTSSQAAKENSTESVAHPTSSQPSAQAESQDASNPSKLASSREEEARPSRRSRPSISYAEPNLRAKMRRPTNEFVDAVAVGPQADTAVKVEEESASVPVTVKTVLESDGLQKAISGVSSSTAETSPLNEESITVSSLANSITTHRKRRESILTESDVEFREQGSAIAALLAEKRRAKAEARDKEMQAKDGKRKAESADIYEFRCSSPEFQERGARRTKDAKPVSRSRRHTATGRDITYAEDSDASDTESWRAQRQSSLNRRSSTLTAGSEKEVGGGDKGLRKSTSASSVAGSAESRAESRTDRIAARRRSMML